MSCMFKVHVQQPYFLCMLYVVDWVVMLDVVSR